MGGPAPQRIARALIVVEGTVYPLLSRLRALGLVDSEWVESDSGHPRKYYRLTPAGRQRALEMSRTWTRFSSSMNNLLAPLIGEERKE
jgi:PadR family transcriptional regulator PadR